jgi:hypothetical protein
MAELIEVVNCLFKNRSGWKDITDNDKEKFFFIINRYLSKKYSTKSQFLNIKSENKSKLLDLWFYFLMKEPYPNWFWSKSPKTQEMTNYDKKDINLLIEKLQLNKLEDLEYLIQHYPEIIKEELKFYKSKNK